MPEPRRPRRRRPARRLRDSGGRSWSSPASTTPASSIARSQAGVSAYLTKPINDRELDAAIRLAASRHAEFEALEAEVDKAQQALADRKLVERAKGLLMTALNLSEQDAFRRLQLAARERNLRLADVARRVVEQQSLLEAEARQARRPLEPAAQLGGGGPASRERLRGRRCPTLARRRRAAAEACREPDSVTLPARASVPAERTFATTSREAKAASSPQSRPAHATGRGAAVLGLASFGRGAGSLTRTEGSKNAMSVQQTQAPRLRARATALVILAAVSLAVTGAVARADGPVATASQRRPRRRRSTR